MTNEEENEVKIEPQKITKEDVNSAKEVVEEAREQSDILAAYDANLESEQQILEEIDLALQKNAEKMEEIKKEHLKDERDV